MLVLLDQVVMTHACVSLLLLLSQKDLDNSCGYSLLVYKHYYIISKDIAFISHVATSTVVSLRLRTTTTKPTFCKKCLILYISSALFSPSEQIVPSTFGLCVRLVYRYLNDLDTLSHV